MKNTIPTSHSPLDQLRRRTVGAAPTPRTSQFSPSEQAELNVLLTERSEYIDDPMFHERGARRKVFEESEPLPSPNIAWYHPAMENISNSAAISNVTNVVLTAKQERAIFRQYNFARMQVVKAKDKLGDRLPTDRQARDMLHWHREANRLRETIAQFNLALVLAMAKRARAADVDFVDLVSEGNMVLLRAIDKFNVSKAFKFSTYACDSILKAFGRMGMKYSKYRQMFPTDFDPVLERSDHAQSRQASHESDCADEVKRIVQDNQAELSGIEQKVLNYRYPLDRRTAAGKPLTLEEVGQLVGLTKERVRQIQNRALEKVRHVLEEDFLDGPYQSGADDEAESA